MKVIHLARKPLLESSVAANVLKWRTGGLNVEGCRLNYLSETDKAADAFQQSRAFQVGHSRRLEADLDTGTNAHGV